MGSPTSPPPVLNDAAGLLGSQEPRICRVPEYVSSAGQEAIDLAARAGLHLDPWEQFVLHGALGERADGKWSAFEVGLNVPRQNGKGSIQEARELAGPILFGEMLLIHSAHEQATSSEHFLRLLALFEQAELTARMKKPIRGKGTEAILFNNGARIMFKTRTGGGGRGLSGDYVGLDEAMILPGATTAALVPTMAARSVTGNPQLWYAGSAVDQTEQEHGVVFAGVRQRGIAGAPRVAYFEWSVEGDDPADVPDEVLDDPAMWAQANPGLGIRISGEHISLERGGALGRRAFAVERLGVGSWPDPDNPSGRVIPEENWKACQRAKPAEEPRALALDVNPERSHAAIVAGSESRFVKVLEHRPGTGWVVARAVELAEQFGVDIYVQERGPAGSFIDDLRDADANVEAVSGSEYAMACGSFYDSAMQATLGHEGTPELDAAVKGAVKGPGDAWAWSRKKSAVDISPLVAATLALRGVERELDSVYEDRGVLAITLD
jgi:hypothetical protein